mmetsp:Transcript_29222/g.64654  ORF Transcript_29222/g.64654 Transcript_29222/m.64654 type:complete len:263 (-) Transcript_29222:160-948(-)
MEGGVWLSMLLTWYAAGPGVVLLGSAPLYTGAGVAATRALISFLASSAMLSVSPLQSSTKGDVSPRGMLTARSRGRAESCAMGVAQEAGAVGYMVLDAGLSASAGAWGWRAASAGVDAMALPAGMARGVVMLAAYTMEGLTDVLSNSRGLSAPALTAGGGEPVARGAGGATRASLPLLGACWAGGGVCFMGLGFLMVDPMCLSAACCERGTEPGSVYAAPGLLFAGERLRALLAPEVWEAPPAEVYVPPILLRPLRGAGAGG